jgi:NAD(P) transhydrogenase subunit alpha
VAAARVFIVGAGVAGLQAIATARRLGARSRPTTCGRGQGTDQSLGAASSRCRSKRRRAGRRRLRKAQDESFYRRQREMMMKTVAASDVVITTGGDSRKEVAGAHYCGDGQGDAAGSVIVDLAAERGGNCELTKADEVVVAHGVTILGPTNLASTVPYHASQMYARNVFTLVQHLVQREKGADGKATGAPRLVINLDDEITREILVTQGWRIVIHPRGARSGRSAGV